ncbi:MAG: DUF134 domain-containing protein [Spirochaetaceae bacterium]
MARPEKRRFVVGPPRAGLFKPAGVPARELEEVSLTLDGYEAIRLVDLEGMDHSAAAEELGVSRPTLTRILARARRTVAEALAGGKALAIEGGAVTHERPAGRPRCEGPGPGGRGRAPGGAGPRGAGPGPHRGGAGPRGGGRHRGGPGAHGDGRGPGGSGHGPGGAKEES